MSFDFTYKSYGQLLTTIGARFEIIPASKLDTVDTQAWCLMRHDIDNDPSLALPIAEIENQLGVSSTYYLMTASSLYNIHESDTQKMRISGKKNCSVPGLAPTCAYFT